MRQVSEKELIHERLWSEGAFPPNDYDTNRRIEILINRFLHDKVAGREVLEVGCGLGVFSEVLSGLGGNLTATDLSEKLVKIASERAGCKGQAADALNLDSVFEPESFDIVLSSECIEHTPDPDRAVEQMIKVLKPGGLLSLSSPNLPWQPIVRGATKLKLRPYAGLENFQSWSNLRRILRENNMEILDEYGLHLFPFQIPLNSFSRWLDTNLQFMKPLMINICIFARKKENES